MVHYVYTDVSGHGFGAVFGCQWFATIHSGESRELDLHSINLREIHAAVKALVTWARDLAGLIVIFHIDNSSVCYILNKLYTPINPKIWKTVIDQ